MKLGDTHNRIAKYLRIGVTDRCNLRCRYCMPAEGIDFAHRDDILSYEEIIRLAKVFSDLGVDKVRLTGGEPFMRKDIDVLLRSLSDVFAKVHITTNATLFSDHINLLKEIEISGLNISIDSLDRDRFFMITRRDSYALVMKNILDCIKNGIPTKLNIVVMKGINDMEIIDFVRFGMEHNVEVRFIEAMPFNDDDGNRDVYMPATEIAEMIAGEFPSLQKLVADGSSSIKYTINGKQTVGIIPAYSRSLCSSCDRIRLTPQGELLNCLYAQTGTNLLAMVRDEKVSDGDIQQAIVDSVILKKRSGLEEEALIDKNAFRSMTTIGG
ncbi:MAG: GTP 3',8-cyclase MoaA [Saprospiraceae bacterium]|nr:GTP 3',8-cyclase MoaA [Saprospiraceae bacterium]